MCQTERKREKKRVPRLPLKRTGSPKCHPWNQDVRVWQTRKRLQVILIIVNYSSGWARLVIHIRGPKGPNNHMPLIDTCPLNWMFTRLFLLFFFKYVTECLNIFFDWQLDHFSTTEREEKRSSCIMDEFKTIPPPHISRPHLPQPVPLLVFSFE